MWNLPRSLPALAERLYPGRTTYYLGDYWPTLPSQWWNYWQAPARNRFGHLPKRLLRSQAKRYLEIDATPALRFPHALFPSEFMCRAYEQAAVQVGQARVVLGGVDTGAFCRTARQRTALRSAPPLRLLAAGRLLEAKGIHNAIEALAILTREHGRRDVELTVAGTGEPAHVSSLQRLAHALGVDNRVQFVGLVPQEDMPNVYCSHDVFVFPSIWAEPFGRVLVEAMAARLAVVGTTVGGAGEILHDGETGLTFPPEDSVRLAAQILRLADDRDLRCRLARQGQTFALARFDIGRMTAAIEQYLQEVVRRA
jgi:glycosyltransferase involved in cell wall biosynthesis